MDSIFYSTRQVAEMLGVSASCLSHAVWDGRIDPPAKSPGRGTFLWAKDDINRASLVLRSRDAGDIFDHDLPGSVKEELLQVDKLLEPVNVR